MPPEPTTGRDARIIALIGTGHFLSHFYVLCLPPMFLAWQRAFDVRFAQLGLDRRADVRRDRAAADAGRVPRWTVTARGASWSAARC